MYADPLMLEAPQWSGQRQRRLLVSLVMSTFCIATLLSVLRFPGVEQARPVAELMLQVLIDEVESIINPVLPDTGPAAVPDNGSADEAASPQAAINAAPQPELPGRRTDWYGRIPAMAAAAVDDSSVAIASVNPLFDAKRREAAAKFAPSKAKHRTPIWENVEKDTMGRSVLWSGDCYRVIDDPNVGSREAFETFGQYITHCMNWKDSPKELPWVSEIRSRRASQARYGRPAAE